MRTQPCSAAAAASWNNHQCNSVLSFTGPKPQPEPEPELRRLGFAREMMLPLSWGLMAAAVAASAACNLTEDWAMPDGHGHLHEALAGGVSGRCCDDRGGAQLTVVGQLVGSAITFNFTRVPTGKHSVGPAGTLTADCRRITFGPNPKEAWQRWPPLPVPPPPPPAPPAPPPPPLPPPAPPASHHPVPTTSAAEVVAAGEAMLARVLPPEHASMFRVEHIPCDSVSGNEALEYEAAAAVTGNSSALVTLRGCTGVAVASALNWYLKEQLKIYEAPTWSALPPLRGLPATLPLPKEKRRIVRPVRFSWYTNVCAASYSFVWWNWARWEQEIDLMAMNGVNVSKIDKLCI